MKVAIVCGAPSSEFLAPFDDEEYEIWVLGNRIDHYRGKRVTRIFEIHDNLTEHGDPEKYKHYLYSFELPLIVGSPWALPARPGFEAFPYKAVEELYGSLYLTASPAYMIAYAVLQGATEIGLYGVDLSIGDHEYFWQRPCVEAWVGFAKGRGIKVFIPEVSHVGKCKYVEGRDWGNETDLGLFTEEAFTAMAEQHTKKKEGIQAQRQALALEAALHDGASQAYMHIGRICRAIDAKVDVKTLDEATRITTVTR